MNVTACGVSTVPVLCVVCFFLLLMSDELFSLLMIISVCWVTTFVVMCVERSFLMRPSVCGVSILIVLCVVCFFLIVIVLVLCVVPCVLLVLFIVPVTVVSIVLILVIRRIPWFKKLWLIAWLCIMLSGVVVPVGPQAGPCDRRVGTLLVPQR